MNPTTQALISARALIEQGWCQHAYARDANGEACDIFSATSWCIRGAMRKACNIGNTDSVDNVWIDGLSRLVTALDSGYLTDWNDSPTTAKADVLALFDKAIEQDHT